MDVWPYALLTPRTEHARLQGVAIMGGRPISGPPNMARIDGGGFWVIEQTFLLHGSARIRTARAIEAIVDGGASAMVARVYPSFAPEGSVEHPVQFSDGSSFSDGTLFGGAPDGATVVEAASLRATKLRVAMIAGALGGGERFSIQHPTKGWRLYTVARVNGDEISIRPPLREAVEPGAALNFTTPGCVCRMVNADDFLGALGVEHVIEATAQWVEAP